MTDDATPAKVRLTDKLGQLPDPFETERYFAGPHDRTFDLYTSDQMRAYAEQEVAAERERLRAAILDWWASRRPVGWDAKQHAAHPLVNIGPSDEQLAMIATGIEME